MSPEQTVRTALGAGRRAAMRAVLADALLCAAACSGLLIVSGAGAAAAFAAGGAVGAGAFLIWRRRLTDRRVATAFERAFPALQNLLVTLEEVFAGRHVHPIVLRELEIQAADRLRTIDASTIAQPSLARLGLTAGAVVAVVTLAILGTPGTTPLVMQEMVTGSEEAPAPGALHLKVTVTPPAYSGREANAFTDPAQVAALEGSTVRIEAATSPDAEVQLSEPGGASRAFVVADGTATIELVARASRAYLITRLDQHARTDRLLQVRVQPDAPPVVVIDRPARDLMFGAASGTIPVHVTARDDLNVADLRLRYTRITGSGEAFTFQEGEIPLAVAAPAARTAREATGAIELDRLQLEEGDTLVYRALVRDDKPGADPVASESYLVEIGKRGEASATGFSVPDDRDRQGLSQQMLIVKTERLHAARAKLAADAVLEQSRLLGVEQRMVRAEFVFMTGGEVVDEVEEAEHAHELASGRLENAGQVELLNAVREMSRAEARLNAGDTAEALVFERAALRALERAFDRRRYFLRTLPERARIDLSRRLSGDLSTARPVQPPQAEPARDATADALRETIAALSERIASGEGLNAVLAARSVAFNPDDSALQRAAAQLTGSASATEKVAAAASVRDALTIVLRTRLASAATERVRLEPFAGFYGGRRPR